MSCFAQQSMTAVLTDSVQVEADQIVAIDNFDTMYYTINSAIHKKPKNNPALNYSNVQLGVPTAVNAFNPLKINVFYQDFNTVVILDNRFAEIFKIDFNTKQPYKNVTHVSTGYDNTIWIFNQDLQQLELYDYKADKIKATTLPVQSNVLDLKSDYNYCWMLTENYLYQYTYFGSLVSKIKNKGFKSIAVTNENLVIETETGLLYKPTNSETLITIATKGMLIKQFLLTNETLYIYDRNTLRKYQLKIK